MDFSRQDFVDQLLKSVQNWNSFRKDYSHIVPDLSEQDFTGKAFIGANFKDVNFENTILEECKLMKSNFSNAHLNNVKLDSAHLLEANFEGAVLSNTSFENTRARKVIFSNALLIDSDLTNADMSECIFYQANLSNATILESNLEYSNFQEAILINAIFDHSNLNESIFFKADLTDAYIRNCSIVNGNFTESRLVGCDLSSSRLNGALMIRANVESAIFNNCNVYGVSVWDVDGVIKEQKDLEITIDNMPSLTIDNIKVAQFIYLIISNSEIRDIINSIASKAVLILGRFSENQKNVLESIKNALRAYGYLPILFDFEKPSNRHISETVKILIGLSRFVIADLSDARSVLQELEYVKAYSSIPVKLIRNTSSKEYGMLNQFLEYPWILDVYFYESNESLQSSFKEEILDPLERYISQRNR